MLVFSSLLLVRPGIGFGAERWLGKGDAAIVVAGKIRPYLEARDGALMVLKDQGEVSADSFILTDYSESGRSSLLSDILNHHYRFIIAIGPEAGRFLAEIPPELELPPVVFSMMLNPEKIIGPGGCGVFFNIPPAVQVDRINRALPSVKRIGLLYDPSLNNDFMAEAQAAVADQDFRLVPLTVSSKKDLPRILGSNWDNIDGLWLIPDRTVISESIVGYLIKEAFLHGVPTIGYNRFFADSGALLSFFFDYGELGEQAAALALHGNQGEVCGWQTPRFHQQLNREVGVKLGLTLADPSGNEGGMP